MTRRGNGEGSIYQRKDGRWVASFKPENSKRVYLYGKTRKEVREKLKQALQEEKQGVLATGPHQKMGVYLLQWLETVVKSSVRPTTYAQYRSAINAHLIPAFGDILIRRLTVQHVQALYAQKLSDGLAPATVAVIHRVLGKALENAVRWNLVPRNVARLASPQRIPRFEGYILSLEEAHRLIAAARGTRLEALLIVAVTMGMRKGEISALRWTDIDLDAGVLLVRKTVVRLAGYGFVENEPKTKGSRRKIMIPDVTVKALREHRVRQEQERARVGDRWQDKNLVFPNTRGGFWNPQYMVADFKKLLEQAGIPVTMRFHDLRHSAASILLAKGVHPKVVQELLGHSTIAMTMDRYSHLLPSMQQEARDKMDDAFGNL